MYIHMSVALSMRIATCRMATENFFNLKISCCSVWARRREDVVDEAMRVRSMRCIRFVRIRDDKHGLKTKKKEREESVSMLKPRVLSCYEFSILIYISKNQL